MDIPYDSDTPSLGREYRRIAGWSTVRPPVPGFIVKASVEGAAPDYDPNRVSRLVIIDPGKRSERMFDPTKGRFIKATDQNQNQSSSNRNAPAVMGPSLFAAVTSPEVEKSATAPPLSPSAPSQTTNRVRVELEVRGFPLPMLATYHRILYVGSPDAPSYIGLVWDLNDKSDRVSVRGQPNTEMAVHIVGSSRIFVCDISDPIIFTFENFEICLLPVVKEGVYVAD